MPLSAEQGRLMLQLLTSRYDDRHWRKKIEKTLSLPATGVGDETQRALFLYLKQDLRAYKSRRADPDSWIVGGYATREVIDRVKFQPSAAGSSMTKEDVACFGTDPGVEVDEDWWNEMLVAWFEEPGAPAADTPQEVTDSSSSGGCEPEKAQS